MQGDANRSLCKLGRTLAVDAVGIHDLKGIFFEDLSVFSTNGRWEWGVRLRSGVHKILSEKWLMTIASRSYATGRAARGSFLSPSNWTTSLPGARVAKHPIRPAIFFRSMPVQLMDEVVPTVAPGTSALHQCARIALSDPHQITLPYGDERLASFIMRLFIHKPRELARMCKSLPLAQAILSTLTSTNVRPGVARELYDFIQAEPADPNAPRMDETLDHFVVSERAQKIVPMLPVAGGIVSFIVG